MLAKFSNGSELVLKSLSEKANDTFKINILDKNFCNIYEHTGRAIFSNGDIIKGKLDLHSEISGPTITKILLIKLVIFLHLKSRLDRIQFFESMLNNWNKSMNKNDKAVPIT